MLELSSSNEGSRMSEHPLDVVGEGSITNQMQFSANEGSTLVLSHRKSFAIHLEESTHNAIYASCPLSTN